ncbi:MAG: class I SAM-dependent methyltransferase [Fimbriimonadaceae bacterium]
MNTLRDDGRCEPVLTIDHAIAPSRGAYASYVTSNDPYRTDFHGDSPAVEMDRLLDALTQPHSKVLDLGSGAGFTLCRLASRVAEIWGVDLDRELMDACRARVKAIDAQNARLILGDTTDSAVLTQLPDSYFTLAFSRRGPFLTEALTKKLAPEALFVVELAQDFLGLKELFGRTPSLPRSSGDPDWAISVHAGVGFVPVSAKTYWYEEWFRDTDHLGVYLSQGAPLQNWWMEPCPYEPSRDRPALELYARYNRTPEGIRLVGQRKVYVFRRHQTNYYPVVGAQT